MCKKQKSIKYNKEYFKNNFSKNDECQHYS